MFWDADIYFSRVMPKANRCYLPAAIPIFTSKIKMFILLAGFKDFIA